jgi:phosphatidate cytidylyltransferase
MNRVLIRVIGAPLLLAALAVCLYFDYSHRGTDGIALVIGILAGVSFNELCEMAVLKGLKPLRWLGLAFVVVPFLSLILGPWNWVDITLIRTVSIGAILTALVLRSKSITPPDAAFTLLAVLYISLLDYIFYSPFMLMPPVWLRWLLFLLATNKGSDMAAYVVGKSLGRHKLAPAVSPNKTWEGAAAGFLVGTVAGYFALKSFFHDNSIVPFVAVAAVTTVAAQMGDLIKSAIKRWAGVKDSGDLLPEFGGTLDMIGSFILSAPAAVITLGFVFQ